MVEKELHGFTMLIQQRGCEEQTTEVKAAHFGCPEKLYDTISSFSNQNSGGTFVFGLDEKSGFSKVGVYDAQDLQKKVMEYCEQMTPVVRPVFTVCNEDELVFVSAEILFVSTNVLFCVFGAKIAGYFCSVYALQGCRKKLRRKDLNLKFGSHLLTFTTKETSFV